MNDQFSLQIIENVKAVIDKNYPDLKGAKLNIEIAKQVDKFTDAFPGDFDQDAKDFLIKKVMRRLKKTMEDGTLLVDNSEFTPWFKDRKGDIEDFYWNDYKTYLLSQPGWTLGPTGTVTKLDEITDDILKLCADPNGPSSKRKGMVVGNVQSGKTANYLGLISKATDAGYKVIIIIAGMLEELRKQTQIRLEESFVGVNAIDNKEIGVGVFSRRTDEKVPLCVTNRESDFRKQRTQDTGNLSNITASAPYVIVVKKNLRVLNNLNDWLDSIRKNNEQHLIHKSMLLIDDEADNASIDLKSRVKDKKPRKPLTDKQEEAKNKMDFPEEHWSNYDATKINASIRKIIKKFKISTYIGYTATPFANIFISPKTHNKILNDDLFPKHFLCYLEPASEYFGPTEAFIKERNKRFFNEITEDEISSGRGIRIPHKKDYKLDLMPDSLKESIHSFVIATSIRWLNGEEKEHSSMLVNASSYTDTQVSIADVIKEFTRNLANGLKASTGLINELAVANNFYRDLHNTFERNFKKDTKYSWNDLKNNIHMVASKIDVLHINRLKTSEKLNYEMFPNGRVVIAVGGFSLSRGLTLKGLVSSYYLRTSKMYDTILQMGRWFGYRDDYENLCRLFMTKNAREDFKFIAGVVKNLNSQIKIMKLRGQTPQDFALYLRSHEDTQRLMATGRLKMGAAKKILITNTHGGKFIQNYFLEKDKQKVAHNKLVISEFLSQIKQDFLENRITEEVNERLKSRYAFKDIPSEKIINLIENFNLKFDLNKYDKDSLLKYLKKRKKSELPLWELIIDSGDVNNMKNAIDVGGFNLIPVKRETSIKDNIGLDYIAPKVALKNSAISSPDMYSITLSKKELEEQKDFAQKNDIKLGSAILQNNKIPKLLVTIIKLDLRKYIDEEDISGVKEHLINLPELYTLNLILPSSISREKPREAWVNIDMNNPYQRVNEPDLFEDGDD